MFLLLIMSIERIKVLYSNQFEFEKYIPNDSRLQQMLVKAKRIKRFTGNDLPSDVVKDNVYCHTIRAIALSENLSLPSNIMQTVQYMVLIHDMPEVQNLINIGRDRDVTAPEKELDPDLESRVSKMEFEVAKEILTSYEYLLYHSFEKAGEFLKTGNLETSEFIEAGIFAQLLDKIDANLTLHRYLSVWFRSIDYNPDKIISSQSLTFYKRQYASFIKNLSMVSKSIYFNQYINLLNLQNSYVNNLWSE